MPCVGPVVKAVSVSSGDEQIRTGQLAHLLLDGAEGQAAEPGQLAEMELFGRIGKEQAHDLTANFGEDDLEGTH